MAQITAFPAKIHFAPDILKYEDDDGHLHQEIIIALKKDGCKYTIISPATSMLRQYISLAASTQHEYARRVCEFLNYAYFEQRCVDRFEQISTEHVIGFLNYLSSTGHAKSYVKLSRQILTAVFYYTVLNYPGICRIDPSEFSVASTKKRKVVLQWPDVETSALLPSSKTDAEHKTNKISNLNTDLVMRFMETAAYESPDSALGFYYIFFGGLRGSEALHLTSDDIPSSCNGRFFSVTLKDRILNLDAKYSDLRQNKKQRRQTVIYIKPLYDMIYANWKEKYGSGAIVRNHSGKPMSINVFEFDPFCFMRELT